MQKASYRVCLVPVVGQVCRPAIDTEESKPGIVVLENVGQQSPVLVIWCVCSRFGETKRYIPRPNMHPFLTEAIIPQYGKGGCIVVGTVQALRSWFEQAAPRFLACEA